MAKKAAAKKTAAKTTNKETTSEASLLANEELNERLEGLQDYYKSKNKAELSEFVNTAIEKMQDFSDSKKHLFHYLESERLAEQFEKTKEREFDTCLTLTGQIISHLNESLTITI